MPRMVVTNTTAAPQQEGIGDGTQVFRIEYNVQGIGEIRAAIYYDRPGKDHEQGTENQYGEAKQNKEINPVL